MQAAGKVALVTGAARRVGKAIALALADRGAHVVITYNTSGAEAFSTLQEIETRGVKGMALKGNITRRGDVDTIVEQVIKRFDRIDILVNNASNYYKTPFETLTEEQWDDLVGTNLKGTFLVSKRVGDEMLKAGSGKIINLADWAGFRPYKDYIPYCIAKAGVIALTKALAKTLAPHIQVNAVAPGPVMLPEDFSDNLRQAVVRATPLKRIGTPADIAQTVVFLVEGSDFITGAIIPVDGGRLIA
ncbi:MAG TPA: SDR family oxidoreductase [Candidatus Tectomicrobia bacterium]|nr:SDR family oxidoreductase [Candidatus Tectomicrobia bacterium]